MFVSKRERYVEWGDCDPAGIVFNPRFFEWFDAATAGIFTAVSGRYPLLKGGANVWTGHDGNSPIGGLQPRTAIGVSGDGRYLFLVTTSALIGNINSIDSCIDT